MASTLGDRSPPSALTHTAVYALIAVALAAGVALVVVGPLGWGETLGLLVFPIAVLAAAWYGGMASGLLAGLLSAFVIAFLFAPPIGSFAVERIHDRITLGLFVMTCLIESTVLGTSQRTRRGLEQVTSTLRASEAKYRLLFERNPEPMWVFDCKSHAVVAANQAAVDTYGYSPTDIVGIGIRKIFHPDDVESFIARIQEELPDSPNDRVAPERWRHCKKDGSILEVESLSTPAPWYGGKGRLLVARDMTQQRRNEAALHELAHELRRAKETAEEASEAKDRFIKVLSHELRTPLTPVLFGLSVLERSEGLTSTARDTLNMIRRNIQLEAKLIDDLLDLSRITSNKLALDLAPVNASTLIVQAVEMCTTEANGKGLSFETRLGASDHVVVADAERLKEVLRSLMRNAIRVTPEGGTIRVWTHDGEPGRIRIGVTDRGAGLSKEDLTLVFEPFEQIGDPVTGRAGGLGLGLTISRSIVDALGGKLTATSEGNGKGATFVIELPTEANPSERRPFFVTPT